MKSIVKKITRKFLSSNPFIKIANKLNKQDIVFLYHSVTDNHEDNYKYTVLDSVFSNQLDVIKENFKIVPLNDLLTLNNEGYRRAAITFDDALYDFYQNAFQILKKKNIPATMFVPTSFIESDKQMLANQRHCTWKEMREMLNTGLINFESHGHSHKHIRGMSLSELKNDIKTSIDLIETNLNTKVNFFAYPGGKFREEQHLEILKLGFMSVCTSKNRLLDNDRSIMPRISIENNWDLKKLKFEFSGINKIIKSIYKLYHLLFLNFKK